MNTKMKNACLNGIDLKKLFFVVGLLSIGTLDGCGEGEDRQASYLERAKEHYAAENYEKANVDARNVLQINPKNLDARVLLADIAFSEGNIRKAFGTYSAVLDEDSANLASMMGLAKIHTAVRDFEKGLEYADRVIAIEPKNSDAIAYKALAFMGLEKSEEAFVLAQSALDIDPSSAAALGVASQYLGQQEKYSEALGLLTKGQAVSPDDARIAMMKVSIYEALGDTAGLEKELLGLSEQFPDSVQYSNALVRFYTRESQPKKAEKSVRQFAAENPDSYDAKRRVIQYLLQQESQDSAIAQAREYMQADDDDTSLINTLAEVYLFTGDKEKGIEILKQSIDTDPKSVGAIEARVRLMQIYLRDSESDSANKMIAEILEIEPENELALLTRAGVNLQNRQLKDAIIDLRTIVKNNPENKTALRALAQAQEAQGSVDLALDNYKKLMGIGDVDVQTLTGAARLAILTEQYQEAEKYIRSALQGEEQSDNPRLVTDLVRLLALKEDWVAAEEFSQRLVDSEDSKALGYYLKGGIKQQLGDDKAALDSFRASLVEQPNAMESLSALSTLMIKVDGLEKATAFIDSHCEEKESAQCLYVLGTLNAQATNFDLAKSNLAKSLSINDQFIRSYRQLAKVNAAQQNITAYEATLKDGIEKTDHAGMKFDLATFYYGTQKYQDAANIYEGLIESRPEQALAAKNNLAMIYAENLAGPENIKKARALVVDLQESENAAYLDTVGWINYLSGDYDTAVTYIKAAVDKLGSAAILQYHLGMAYYKAGDAESAKTHLTLATTEVEAQYPGYDEALETLQALYYQ